MTGASAESEVRPSAVRRPLVWVSGALVGGTGLASACTPPFVPFLIAFLSTWSLGIILTVLRRRTSAVGFVIVSAFALGVCTYLVKDGATGTPDQLAQHYVSSGAVSARLTGVVRSTQAGTEQNRLSFDLDVERIEMESSISAVRGRTRVNWYQPAEAVQKGDVVTIEGTLRPLRGFKNPGAFDYEQYMYRKGIFTRMYARGADALSLRGKRTLAWPERLKEFFRREGLKVIAASSHTPETRAFVTAILLGDRSLLADETKNWFKQTGTFHVLAISGLHVGLVYLVVSLALTPLPIGTKARVAASLLFVWFFAYATGGGISVIRASIMLTIVLTGYYIGRDGDFLTSIAVAALLIVGLNPLSIDEVGFQLSFSAVLLLCTSEPLFSQKFYPFIQQRLHMIPAALLHRLAITVFGSLVVGIGMLPLVAYHFNIVSFTFPVANLVVIPILSLVLASGFVCLILGFFWLKAATLLGFVTEVFAWAIFGTVRLFSMFPFSSLRVVSPSLWILGLEALVIASLWWRIPVSRRIAVLTCAAALAAITAFTKHNAGERKFQAIFFDVGEADSCLLESPAGGTMLIDTGFATPNLDCGESLIAPVLWKKHIRRLDALVLTHPDADHTAGAPFLIRNFQIDRLLIAEFAQTPPEYSDIIRLARDRGCSIEKLGTGDTFSLADDVMVEVLNPPRGVSRDDVSDNDASLVFRITYGVTSLLLAADAQSDALRHMSDSASELHSDILKAPHHGLKSSFNRKFVEIVHPKLTVISGRPYRVNQRMDSRILQYATLCNTVMSTADSGAIVIETDGQAITVRATRKADTSLF